MPIVDVSGLVSDEIDVKVQIRKSIKQFFAKELNISEDSTTVTFITDDTINFQEHVMARLYSKAFMEMDISRLEKICNRIVVILEKAGHLFNEAFPVPVMTMCGRQNKKRVLV